MTNAYPDKPFEGYKKTTVEMFTVIEYLKNSDADKEIKRMAYIMFRNESANGTKGINNNYCGFQADSGRWSATHDNKISGVVKKVENGTGKERLFLAFDNISGCLDMLLERVRGRGIYIGGITHLVVKISIGDLYTLCRVYKKEWVTGNADAEPSKDDARNFKSMYEQAEKLFI